jgi:hypothetical protein
MKRLVGVPIALVALSAAPVVAQRDSATLVHEYGFDVAAVGDRTRGAEAAFFAQSSLRYGFLASTHPWGFDLRVGLSDHTTIARGRQVRLEAGLNVIRAIGARSGANSLAGTYLVAGLVVSRTAPDYHTDAPRTFGLNAGVGRRFTLGRVASIRPEALVGYDFEAEGKEVYTPAAAHMAVRVSFAFTEVKRFASGG